MRKIVGNGDGSRWGTVPGGQASFGGLSPLPTRLQVAIILLAILSFVSFASAQTKPIVIGSKIDTEGRLLGEIFAQHLESRGLVVQRRMGLGGTMICFEALRLGEVDLYPEYSGTIEYTILHLNHRASFEEMNGHLRQRFALEMLPSLGFNNTYAMSVRTEIADAHSLTAISDLRRVPGLRYGFTYEFLNRPDGWKALAKIYGLSGTAFGMEHGLAYQAVAEGKVDVIDAYSTDGKLLEHNVVALQDDKEFFPEYLAFPFVREGIEPRAKAALEELSGKLNDAKMQQLNAQVELEEKDFAEVAALFLRRELGTLTHAAERQRWRELGERTLRHVWLTAVSLLFAILIAVPVGVAAYRLPRCAAPLLSAVSLLQTVPSIALLAVLIPLVGIGVVPAIIALFLYALLPIVRNTTTALLSIDPLLKRIATGMGFTAWQQLRFIELPLAVPHILAGIRTAAVINIGTATLAAFIGAGGLGEPIVTGLNLNNTGLILEGAIPAALLAALTEKAFELVERSLVPVHLRTCSVRKAPVS